MNYFSWNKNWSMDGHHFYWQYWGILHADTDSEDFNKHREQPEQPGLQWKSSGCVLTTPEASLEATLDL